MPRAVHVATGTADAQAVGGAATLLGYSVRESAVVAAFATIILRNGTTATAPVVAVVELAADKSESAQLPAVDCSGGLFVDRVAGETELVLYVS